MLKFISLNLDHVVVSIKKMSTTNNTSMKGIRLMSGSGDEFFLNFKMSASEVYSRMAAKWRANRSADHSICRTNRSTLLLKKRQAIKHGMATIKPIAVL